ncbi:hypothetical protein N8I77_010254 [Diaporthe amygdali]|uniref:Transmembrane protein n=1 Tax=Phomopsis amygdali TaxID=1214568 RepID=A0AAD9VZ39_PHOAM|nr:hypothetical protein N8I77_010254 [Diaporthe amygdali]
MPVHGLDIGAMMLLLVEKTGAASIRNKLGSRQDDDGIDTPDDDDDVAAAPAPTTTDPATATTSAASTETATSARQLDTGSKAGIAIGVIVGVIFLGGAVFMYWRHRRRQRWQRRNKYSNNNSRDPNEPNMTMNTHNLPPKSVGDSSPPLGSVSPPSTNPDAGRPWFDNGAGSTELPSREVQERDRVAGWVYEKAELSAPKVGNPTAAQQHPHYQYYQYSNSTELPTAGNQIHEIPETSACSYAPVELPAALPESVRYSGFTGFSGGEGEEVDRNVSTRTSNTDESTRRESAAPTFTVSSPATTVAETVSDSGYVAHVGQVSPASPYARSTAGGNTM